MDGWKFITIIVMFQLLVGFINANVDSNDEANKYLANAVDKRLYTSQQAGGDSAQADYGAQQKDTNYDNTAGNTWGLTFNLWEILKESMQQWDFGTPRTYYENLFANVLRIINAIVAIYGITALALFIKNKWTGS